MNSNETREDEIVELNPDETKAVVGGADVHQTAAAGQAAKTAGIAAPGSAGQLAGVEGKIHTEPKAGLGKKL